MIALVYFCIAIIYLPFILPLIPHPILGMVVFIILATVPFVFLEHVRVIERHGLYCKSCGYNLKGLTEPRCPECGTEFSS